MRIATIRLSEQPVAGEEVAIALEALMACLPPPEAELIYVEEGFKEEARKVWEKIYQLIQTFWAKLKYHYRQLFGETAQHLKKVEELLHHVGGLSAAGAKVPHEKLTLSAYETMMMGTQAGQMVSLKSITQVPLILNEAILYLSSTYHDYVYEQASTISRTISSFRPADAVKQYKDLHTQLAARQIKAGKGWRGNQFFLPGMSYLSIAEDHNGIAGAELARPKMSDAGSMTEIQTPALLEIKAMLLSYKAMLARVLQYHTQVYPHLDSLHNKLVQDTANAMRQLNAVTEGANNAHAALQAFQRCANYNVSVAKWVKNPVGPFISLANHATASGLSILEKALREYEVYSGVSNKAVKT